MTRRALVRLGCGALIAVACTEIPSSPTQPFAITFPPAAYPSIVQGDTLRDAAGVAAPLTAIVYNVSGGVIPGAPVRFYAIDTANLVTLDSVTGILVSTGLKRGTVRVLTTIAGLQSDTRTIPVVARPDSVTYIDGGDTLFYSYSDTTVNVSDNIAVRVLHDSTTMLAVDNYLVRYELADPTDTTIAGLIDDQNRRGTTEPHGRISIDSTSGGGNAIRRIRVRPSGSIATPVDSVVVLAYVRYRGAEVRGSPVRVAIPLKQRTIPSP